MNGHLAQHFDEELPVALFILNNKNVKFACVIQAHWAQASDSVVETGE